KSRLIGGAHEKLDCNSVLWQFADCRWCSRPNSAPDDAFCRAGSRYLSRNRGALPRFTPASRTLYARTTDGGEAGRAPESSGLPSNDRCGQHRDRGDTEEWGWPGRDAADRHGYPAGRREDRFAIREQSDHHGYWWGICLRNACLRPRCAHVELVRDGETDGHE